MTALNPSHTHTISLHKAGQYIIQHQQSDGSIPWFHHYHLDPWCHIEAMMGLCVTGHYDAAKNALHWLAAQQLQDGSWYAKYIHSKAIDTDHRETNFTAYIAVGLAFYYICTKDSNTLKTLFPIMEKAINWVLKYQTSSGEIYWAVTQNGQAKPDALVTGCCSIYKSLDAAVFLAQQLGKPYHHWAVAKHNLKQAITSKPHCFDRTWKSKSRFAMDWFYPILTGIIEPQKSKSHIEKRWSEFVVHDMGCKCVNDEPWVTVAETCELIISLSNIGEKDKAIELFNALLQFQDKGGGFWTGYNYRDDNIWPRQKTTWTAAAVLLAADSIYALSPASHFFVTINNSDLSFT